MGGSQVERCCPWTQTAQGVAGRVGRPDGGRRCLGEIGPRLGRHCAGRCSPLVEKRWLRERNPVSAGESLVALKATFSVASSVVPWKAHNRMVGHPLIGLDR